MPDHYQATTAPVAAADAPKTHDPGAPSNSQQSEQRIAMSYADYLQCLSDHALVEWVNGEAIVFVPPTIRHQALVTFLLTLMAGLARILRAGKVFTSPIEMRLSDTLSRQPDLLFVANAHLHRLTDQRLVGPADLVVEIISDESAARDRSDKFYEYQIAGVREYWIIDPRPGLARADFWVLDDDGRYRPVPISADGTYTSTVLPQLRLRVAALLADELPDPLQALARMVGVDTLLAALHGKLAGDA